MCKKIELGDITIVLFIMILKYHNNQNQNYCHNVSNRILL